MKISPIILAVFLCASAFAGSVAVPRLPLPEYLDTEVSTNVVFSLPDKTTPSPSNSPSTRRRRTMC